MKKLLSIALALILATTMFTACAPADTDTSDDATITRYTTEGKETKLVGDPNATGELTISSLDVDYGEQSKSAIALAIDKYKELYPNVDVKYEKLQYTSNEAYEDLSKKLQTEVMSGKGPDVFFSIAGMDKFKLAKSGNLADLTDYFENDKNFNVSDYNETVLYSGQFNGKQYLLPIGYNISTLLTTQKIIDNQVINTTKMGDYIQVTEEIVNVFNRAKNEMLTPIIGANKLGNYMKISGIEFIDYSKNSANINTESMREVVALYKNINQTMNLSQSITIGGGYAETAGKLFDNKAVVDICSLSDFFSTLTNASYISLKDEPVLIPYKNIRGHQTATVPDVAMVNNSSKNKQHAYNFLKVLISPEIQGYTDMLFASVGRGMLIPISNDALDMMFDSLRPAGAFQTPTFGGLSQEFIDSYKAIIDDIDSVSYELPCDSIIAEELQRYYDGDMDINTCLESLQGKLEIYISE